MTVSMALIKKLFLTVILVMLSVMVLLMSVRESLEMSSSLMVSPIVPSSFISFISVTISPLSLLFVETLAVMTVPSFLVMEIVCSAVALDSMVEEEEREGEEVDKRREEEEEGEEDVDVWEDWEVSPV